MIYHVVSHHIRKSIQVISLSLCLLPALTYVGLARPVTASDTVTPPPVIVIGFVGGFVRHDATVHSAVQVAAHLRHDYPTGVYVEVLENSRREKAYEDIVRFIDANRDGALSIEEKKNARIILYGHSWGASEVVTLARELQRQGIPVLLTVQVDSVVKFGENDRVIPANVAEAANFYQLDGLLHGESLISAAEPSRTHIIGNFRSNYKANPVDCKEYPWYDRVFMKFHTEIECDPRVWAQVESLIQSRLPVRR
jgi:hypothetical protein